MYGDAILRKKAENVKIGVDFIKPLVLDMFETMHAAQGVGLAAPQIGKSLRIFVVDESAYDEKRKAPLLKRAFINPEIIKKDEKQIAMNEGCLSIPDVREDIMRSDTITIKYWDEDGNFHQESYEGITARIIQHEYDHIEGVLFIDYLSPLRKRMLKKKLSNISRGEVSTSYRIVSPSHK